MLSDAIQEKSKVQHSSKTEIEEADTLKKEGGCVCVCVRHTKEGTVTNHMQLNPKQGCRSTVFMGGQI